MKRIRYFLLLVLYVVIIFVGIIISYLSSITKISQNEFDIVKGGEVASFDMQSLTKDYIGEWELYYNDFIVSDNVERDYDTLVEMPGRWTNSTTKSGEKLSSSGYASYRIKVIGIHDGTTINCVNIPLSTSIRVYINKTLIFEAGKLGKTLKDNKVSSKINVNETYKKQGNDPVEIVVEVGYNNAGGIDSMPLFAFHNSDSYMIGANRIIPIIIVALIIPLIIVEVVSIFTVKDSNYTTAVVAITLLFSYLNSYDALKFYTIFNIPYSFYISTILCNLFLLISVSYMFVFMIKNYKIKFIEKEYYFIIGSIILSIIYSVLTYFGFGYIGLIIEFSIISILLCIYSYLVYKSKRVDSFFVFSASIIATLLLALLYDVLGSFNVIYTRGFVGRSYMYFLIIALFIFIYAAFIVRTTISAYRNEAEVERFKSNILKEQMKPHYIFNSLNAIKTLYHEGEEKGDYALSLFSKNLRSDIDNIEQTFVSFEKELDYIMNFVNLENLKKEDKFNVIFNIEVVDFYVPILSLQPYIENSIKYSKVNQKEDGYIEISSREEGDDIIIEIIDNGVGFNMNEVKETSKGIRNSIERFKILLGVDVVIESKIDEGTRVKVALPKDKIRGKGNENNNS
ncbi:MAG: histidine kinase [Gammaproteobacteria bacterium]|nr:histidine kinase [Gammaproteobacteria bacterium]